MRNLCQKGKQVGGDGIAVDGSLRVRLHQRRQVNLVYIHQRIGADHPVADFQILVRCLEVAHGERTVTELKSHEAVAVFVDLFLGQHPVPDMLLAENVGNLVDLGVEVQPLLRVVLHELAVLCLLRQDKESPYLRKFSSLKVAEVASCQKFRILRHLVVIGLFAEDILFLQGISLAKSLYDGGEHILKAQVLLRICTELLHGIGHFKDYGRFAFCSEKNNMVVHLFQLGIEPVKCAFFVGSHRMMFVRISFSGFCTRRCLSTSVCYAVRPVVLQRW